MCLPEPHLMPNEKYPFGLLRFTKEEEINIGIGLKFP